MTKIITEGEKALKLLNTACGTAKITFAAAASHIDVEPNDVYRWRNMGAVPGAHIDKVTEWSHKTMHYHVPPTPKTPKAMRYTKPKAWDGAWIHTTPEKIQEFLVRHAMRRGDFAVKVRVISHTVTAWLEGRSVATPTNQLVAANFIEKFDKEKNFVDEPFEGRRRDVVDVEGLGKRKSARRDKLAVVLMKFYRDDGLGEADATVHTASILKLLTQQKLV